MSAIRAYLDRRLAAGEWILGQIHIRPDISLRHVEEGEASALEIFTRPEAARELAKYDDAGNYRPLKTAPNLRHGWELRLRDLDELRLALDLFYPAALGTRLAWERGELPAVALRDTLGRQTGMYRVTQLIRDDQAEALVEKICAGGCLRRRLWVISGAPAGGAEIADSKILCAEACNLFVAACRPPARENLPKTG